ncbi:hypothetical protein GGX14DRAFT_635458 [Mycena pura]|uniref:Uncharacterized protein n=1 Tax=Mycena pura TaxID=153505 RepID=A0AAD6VB23_9AGAR|nr:hypothetical protein GGX14DRAFT_635458 [Mycena pura]
MLHYGLRTESENFTVVFDPLEHYRKMLDILISSQELPQYVQSLTIADAPIQTPYAQNWLGDDAAAELVCSLLNICPSIQTLSILSTANALYWNFLPSPLRDCLSKVFASPSLRTLHLYASVALHEPTDFLTMFPINSESGLRNLTLTDVTFTEDVPRENSVRPRSLPVQAQLKSLSINYIDEEDDGPKLVSVLLDRKHSPFAIDHLSTFIFAGLCAWDWWACTILDAQSTTNTLRKLGLHGFGKRVESPVFRQVLMIAHKDDSESDVQLPFTQNLERFTNITDMSLHIYSNVHRHIFKDVLDSTPPQVLRMLQKITIFTGEDPSECFAELSAISHYFKSDFTPSLKVCEVVVMISVPGYTYETIAASLAFATERGLLTVDFFTSYIVFDSTRSSRLHVYVAVRVGLELITLDPNSFRTSVLLKLVTSEQVLRNHFMVLEKTENSTVAFDPLEHYRKMLDILISSQELPQYVQSLTIVDTPLQRFYYQSRLSDNAAAELVCSFLNICASIQTLSILSTANTIYWNILPSPLRDCLSKVFASPSLQTLHLYVSVALHDRTDFLAIFPINSESGLRSLTLTDVTFTVDIPRENSEQPRSLPVQAQLKSLSINYIDEEDDGPKLVSVLLDRKHSPFAIDHLSTFIITGFFLFGTITVDPSSLPPLRGSIGPQFNYNQCMHRFASQNLFLRLNHTHCTLRPPPPPSARHLQRRTSYDATPALCAPFAPSLGDVNRTFARGQSMRPRPLRPMLPLLHASRLPAPAPPPRRTGARARAQRNTRRAHPHPQPQPCAAPATATVCRTCNRNRGHAVPARNRGHAARVCNHRLRAALAPMSAPTARACRTRNRGHAAPAHNCNHTRTRNRLSTAPAPARVCNHRLRAALAPMSAPTACAPATATAR